MRNRLKLKSKNTSLAFDERTFPAPNVPNPLSPMTPKIGSVLHRRLHEDPKLQRTQSDLRIKLNKRVITLNKPVLQPSNSQANLTPKLRVSDSVQNHVAYTLNALKYIQQMPSLPMQRLFSQRLLLRQVTPHTKTVIFDLDETLVHCVRDGSPAHVYLDIPGRDGSVRTGINIRPYARDCLMFAGQFYEVIVFTASHQSYADVVLNYLDPMGTLIQHRLYREHCINFNNVYLKDLRMLNRPMEGVVVVDNSVLSFANQLDNGIPIMSWFNDTQDKELYKLMDYLKVLSRVPDIREVNRNVFGLRRLQNEMQQKATGKENVPPGQLFQKQHMAFLEIAGNVEGL